jgi:SAM-dependent methyltransferase
MNSFKKVWENVFTTKPEDQLSWFQPYPKTSVEFLDLFKLPVNANILDVGAGSSHFVDVLIEKGYTNIYILDIAEAALERAKARLGPKAQHVHWIVSDILDFSPGIKFDLWHDRAAFHFLTSDDAVEKYVSIAERSIKPGGFLVLGTFSETGPTKCSGLDVRQYTEASMSARFEKEFTRIKCITEDHLTPAHKVQNFLFCSFQKRL